MIIDHRTYVITPRRMKEYLDVYMRLAMPVQKRHIGDPVGLYLTEVGLQGEFVNLWAYEDYGDMERRRVARDADPDWALYLKESTGLIVSQTTKIIRPLTLAVE